MVSRGTKGRRVAVGFILALAALWVTSILAVLITGRRYEVGKADAIVVLGAAQYWGRPSPVLKSRLDHAIDLWKKGHAPVLILTGGTGKGDTTTEADVGRKYAMGKGIPDEAIVVENQGRTTSESLRTVRDMLKARNMSEVILVSDPFHMLRLKILSARLGMNAETSPTPSSPISANPSQVWRYVISESLKAPLAFFLEKS